MAYWLFQGNPKFYNVLQAINELDYMFWPVTRYAKDISVGDGVLVWIAGAEAGIYAIAEVKETPQVLSVLPDPEYWRDLKNAKIEVPRAYLRLTRKLIGQPLRRSELKSDQILNTLLVIRAPNSTNFKVTDEQWERVHQLKG